MEIVGISFNNNGNIEYFDANGLTLKRNVTVVVDAGWGLRFGKVEVPNFVTKTTRADFDKVVRISSKKDYYDNIQNLKDAKTALKKCRELVKKYNLDMKIVGAEYTLDRNELVFKFIADGRVDFRDLAKDLANRYKTRIELYQLGVRDKAKEVGGCGPCGIKLCCQRFSSNFTSVSINMAKNQNLSLNPTKINGVCGRLLCCLRYEDDSYKECRKCLPKIGKIVEIKEGKGKVVSLDVINKKYTVLIPEKGEIEVSVLDGIC